MESFIPTMEMLEMALEQEEWETYKHYLKILSSADRKTFLQSHQVQDIPTLHYILQFPMREEDEKLIYEIIKLFVDSSYDINQKVSCYRLDNDSIESASRLNSPGYFIEDCTALMAALLECNNVLVECLIRNGATKDFLNSEKQKEHIQDLIYAYSLPQKAIESGHKQITAFLIDNQLYDPARKALLVMNSDHFKSLGKGARTPLEMIPLQVAIINKQWDIAAYLIKTGSDISVVANIKKDHSRYLHGSYSLSSPRTAPPRKKSLSYKTIVANPMYAPQFLPGPLRAFFNVSKPRLENSNLAGDLNSFELLLRLGDKQALPVLGAMLEQGIENALNCNRIDILRAAVKKKLGDFVEQIFNHYAQDAMNGPIPSWLCTVVFTSPMDRKFPMPAPSLNWIPPNWACTIGEYTLLHFACIYECSLDFIKKLVELGANVNSKTIGISMLTPLHISILQKRWKHAGYLIENGADLRSTAVFNGDTGTVDTNRSLNSIHLLLPQSTACRECSPATNFFLSIMDQEERVSWIGVEELNLAIDLGSPECVLKLLTHCAKTTPLKDLMWFPLQVNPSSRINIPLLHQIFNKVETAKCRHIHSKLRSLIQTLASAPYNYNFNSVATGTIHGSSIYGYLYDYSYYTPILFHALATDFHQAKNLLTEALLEYDHLELNVENKFRENPVQAVLQRWSVNYDIVLSDDFEKKDAVNFVVNTVEMLLFKGTDVSKVTINDEFRYHKGLLPMIKLLYRAGANITQSFISQLESNSNDMEELKIWKAQFDQQLKHSLKHRCRIVVRASVKTVGDAKEVAKRLPEQLDKFVWKLNETSQ